MTAREPAAKGREKPAKSSGTPPPASTAPAGAGVGPEAVIELGLEHRLGEVSPWNRFQRLGPYSSGLGRMQQWVTAYTEGVVEAGRDDPAGAPGFIPS